jgi:hypothetical protein
MREIAAPTAQQLRETANNFLKLITRINDFISSTEDSGCLVSGSGSGSAVI